jgi:hypothetical protein
MKPHHKMTNDNTEFLHPYRIVAADTQLEIGTSAISSLLSLKHLSQTLPAS